MGVNRTMSQAEDIHQGRVAFGDDRGTLWTPYKTGDESLPFHDLSGRLARRELPHFVRRKPFVWLVDDELRNRQWFRDAHRDHFAVVTFSNRSFFIKAFDKGLPCDAVVTDVFFPKEPVADNDAGNQLLQIYDDIETTPTGKLHNVWRQHVAKWRLDGFDILRDVRHAAQKSRRSIPVFLYSRKALLLLAVEELDGTPPVPIGYSYWLVEKPNPAKVSDPGKPMRAQRDRIVSALRARQTAAPLWARALSLIGIRVGCLTLSLAPLIQELTRADTTMREP